MQNKKPLIRQSGTRPGGTLCSRSRGRGGRPANAKYRFLGFKGSSWTPKKGAGATPGLTQSLLPIVRRPTPFTERLLLAQELTDLRTAEMQLLTSSFRAELELGRSWRG